MFLLTNMLECQIWCFLNMWYKMKESDSKIGSMIPSNKFGNNHNLQSYFKVIELKQQREKNPAAIIIVIDIILTMKVSITSVYTMWQSRLPNFIVHSGLEMIFKWSKRGKKAQIEPVIRQSKVPSGSWILKLSTHLLKTLVVFNETFQGSNYLVVENITPKRNITPKMKT